MFCPEGIPMVKEAMKKRSDWPRSGMNIMNAGVFTYPHFERDKIVAIELFDDEDFAGFERLLRHMHSKQRYCDGDRGHFLLSAMYNAEFTYPGWPDDFEHVKEVFLYSVNAFVEAETRRLLRAMENNQRLFDDEDLPRGIVTIRSSMFCYEGFEQDKKDAMNAYQCGYDYEFEKCLEQILMKQKIHDANIDEKDDQGSIHKDSAEFSMTGSNLEHESSPTSVIQQPVEYVPCESAGNSEELNQSSVRGVFPPSLGVHAQVTEEANEECVPCESAVKSDELEQRAVRGVSLPSIDTQVTEHKKGTSSEISSDSPSNVTDVRPYLSQCSICLEAVTSHIFVPCGHLALCSGCASKAPYNLRSRRARHRCPICRKQSTDIIKVFY